MKPRFTLALRTARRVLAEANVTQAPVDVETIAQRLGISVRYSPLERSISGTAIRRADGRSIIGVNSNDVLPRQRFSLAHELAHVLLHSDTEFHLDEGALIGFRSEESSKATNPREIEANQFAAELLMPEQFIRRDLPELDHQDLDRAITRMAERYGVSVQAMTIRISKYTNLVP
ncbi:MAG: ImmA/IrrE family metallo-endopeptidase [Thermoanaerobaculia bacterium]